MTASVAILDLGTARAKLAIATISSTLLLSIENTQTDVFFQDVSRLGESIAAVAKLLDLARLKGCRKLLSIGTEYFRADPNGRETAAQLAPYCGAIQILSAELEARLFYQAALLASGREDIYSLDVGGGSIQLAWADTEKTWLSAPLGTVSVEKRFQRDLNRSISAQSDVHQEIAFAVRELLTLRRVPSNRDAQLVVGSNLMAFFFGEVMGVLDIDAHQKGEGVSFPIQNVLRMYEAIADCPYADLERLFPRNSRFMRGADKLLIIVLAVSDALFISEVLATNESVSRQLARLAIENPSGLSRFGLDLKELARE